MKLFQIPFPCRINSFHKHFLIPIFALILICCGAGGNQESEDESAGGVISTSSSCLAEMTDPATWLPHTKVADLVQLPQDEIRQKVYQQLSCSYNWKNDRKYTMKIGASEMEVDAKNVIAIMIKNLDTEIEKWLAHKYVKQTEMSYEEYFVQFHGTPITEDDKKKVNKALDKKAETDENFDEKSAETAKGLLELSKSEKFTEVNGIGDKANYYVQTAPNLRELRLAVLTGNVVMLISVDISDEDDTDLEMAKKVAEAVMANCD
jgi:hypothetical protein